MRTIMICLAIIASCGSSLFAEEKFPIPEQKIVGVEKPVELGELVIVQMSQVQAGTAGKHIVASEVKWQLFEFNSKWELVEKQFQVGDNGYKIFCGAGIKPKRMYVFATVTHLYLVKETDKISEVQTRTVNYRATIVIGEAPPEPIPPNPNPPGPAPVFPDGKYQLSSFTFSNVNLLVTDVTAKVNGAKALIKSLKAINGAIAGGVYSNGEQVLIAAEEKNRVSLAESNVPQDKWSAFGTALQKKLLELDRSDKLITVQDYKVAFEEIILGLESIK